MVKSFLLVSLLLALAVSLSLTHNLIVPSGECLLDINKQIGNRDGWLTGGSGFLNSHR
jgi:hypothetical protein